MSALSSRHETSSRTWWSLASRSSASSDGKVLRRSYSTEKTSRQMPTKPSVLNFNSFASAIGFKSKKHPSLTIQEPPPPIQAITPSPSTNVKYRATYTNRPHSKSFSSTLSPVDSLEPRTPLDAHRDTDRGKTHQSLLTPSDLDPLVGGGVITSHVVSDPNRLSVYSTSSAPEYISKKPQVPKLNLGPYPLSPSHSNSHSELSPSPLSTASTMESALSRKITAKRSTGSLRRKHSLVTDDGSLVSAWENLTHATISKSGSSLTITEKNRLSQPNPTPVPRPLLRARGMTDSVASHQDDFLQKEITSPKSALPRKPSSTSWHPLTPLTSPRVVIRQPSTSRIGLPPSAPPKHELPPPPPSSVPYDIPADDISELVAVVSGDSTSSSGLSFASSVSSDKDKDVFLSQPYSPRQKEKKLAEGGPFSSNGPEMDNDRGTWPTLSKTSHGSVSPRTLKKVLSQQSLGKRSQSNSPIHTPPPERVVEKAPRKQRSFHHPKIPIPPIPLPHRHPNSVGSPSTTPPKDTVPIVEQKQGSGTSSLGRKRLFSVSSHRRPSTSPGIVPEDDTLSIFSLRSDLEQAATSPFKTSSPTTLSFLDEAAHGRASSSPVHVTHEYIPQQIMSPAEMAKVEASVEESNIYARKRGLSLLSALTTLDGEDEYVPNGLSPRPLSWKSGNPDSMPLRSISLVSKSLTAPRLSNRPSTSQATMTPSNYLSDTPFRPSSSPPHVLTSLPPPPRQRHRSVLVSPPSDHSCVTSLPLEPVRRNSRVKVSVEKQLHWRSIMRKPSFLEIDDETDKDTEVETNGKPPNNSFLDLARESFDTARSINE